MSEKEKNIKCIVFDADGVLTLPEEAFSVVYTRSRGLDIKPFEDFFKNEWQPIVTGFEDLKDNIVANPDFWQWSGSPDELLDFWFKAEDVRNGELIKLIKKLRATGVTCYLATDQEKYRAEYMKETMFKDLFDGYFVSAELGFTKTDPRFFELVLQSLRTQHSELEANDIVFFDDSQSKVDTAKQLGIDAILFKNNSQVEAFLDN